VTEALKMIVDGYLGLKNRKALEEMRAHRERAPVPQKAEKP
jgi:hypothetical protein